MRKKGSHTHTRVCKYIQPFKWFFDCCKVCVRNFRSYHDIFSIVCLLNFSVRQLIFICFDVLFFLLLSCVFVFVCVIFTSFSKMFEFTICSSTGFSSVSMQLNSLINKVNKSMQCASRKYESKCKLSEYSIECYSTCVLLFFPK